MRHTAIEQWARGLGPLHSMDARVKLVVVAAFLIAVSTTPSGNWLAFAAFATMVVVALAISNLPIRRLLLRSALLMPFAGVFAILSYLHAGDIGASCALVVRSQLCILATILLVATTPLPLLLSALESFLVPTSLLEIAQFLYRYLFVIVDQGQRMRLAAASRDSGRIATANRRSLLDRAAGALATLFACSYKRAEGIHRATLARGSRGGFPVLTKPKLKNADLLIAAGALLFLLGVRIATLN